MVRKVASVLTTELFLVFYCLVEYELSPFMQVSEIFSKSLLFTDPLTNPEERNPRPRPCENLKTCNFLMF